MPDTVFQIILLILAAAVSCFLIPLIKSKLTTEQFNALSRMVKTAVKAAEMMFTDSKSGASKFEYVKEFIISCGLGKKADNATLKALIEEAVCDMNAVKTDVHIGLDVEELKEGGENI